MIRARRLDRPHRGEWFCRSNDSRSRRERCRDRCRRLHSVRSNDRGSHGVWANGSRINRARSNRGWVNDARTNNGRLYGTRSHEGRSHDGWTDDAWTRGRERQRARSDDRRPWLYVRRSNDVRRRNRGRSPLGKAWRYRHPVRSMHRRRWNRNRRRLSAAERRTAHTYDRPRLRCDGTYDRPVKRNRVRRDARSGTGRRHHWNRPHDASDRARQHHGPRPRVRHASDARIDRRVNRRAVNRRVRRV